MCYALNDSQGSVEQSDIQPVLLHKTDFGLCVFVSRHMLVATSYDRCMMHDGDNLPSSTIAEEADITRPMVDMVYKGLAWFTD